MADSKGILLIALGHPYYGEMAFNLAMSIKYTTSLPVTLLTDSGGRRYLNDEKLTMFDSVLDCPDEYTTYKGRKNYLKPKVYLNHFTPYDKTIYLDVDMILTPKKNISELMDECSGVALTIQNRGFIDLSKDYDKNAKFIIWATTGNIADAFNFTEGKLFNLSSELIYFEKGIDSDAIFKDAQQLFETPNVKYLDFGGGVPDELPFTISMIKNNIYPHKENWKPIFWEHFDKQTPQETEINKRFFGVSLGGNIVPKYTRRIYTNLVKFYARHHKLTTHVQIKDKRQFLTDRTTI